MRQGNRPTTLQQRLDIWERANRGESDAGIAAALQLSPMTVRSWRRRAQRQGRRALESHMGRPKRGPLSQAAPDVCALVRQMRAAHPGWGAATLRLELAADARCQGLRLPSRARLAAFLKAAQLTRHYERRSALPQPPAQPLTTAHQEWEMDAQGMRQLAGVGQVAVINIGDPYSHLRVGSLACLGKSRVGSAAYQLALRLAFVQYGLPQRLSLDHDQVFIDNTCGSPFPRPLLLWVIALGVEVRFITAAPPKEHSFIERTHQVVDHQAMDGQVFPQPAALQAQLDQRRHFLNERYPSRSLAGQPPLVADPHAGHSGRPYRPEGEGEVLDLARVYAYLAPQRWFRHVTAGHQVTVGKHAYGVDRTWAGQQIEVTFDPQTVEFIFHAPDGQHAQRRAAKGLTKPDLMGELDMAQFANYQYAFPWLPGAERHNLLHEAATGTTL